jgi:regulator of replication initiation timing
MSKIEELEITIQRLLYENARLRQENQNLLQKQFKDNHREHRDWKEEFSKCIKGTTINGVFYPNPNY